MSKHATLIFSRHGESEHLGAHENMGLKCAARWNVANIFTGWVDVDLSEKGLGEAKGAGELLKARRCTFSEVSGSSGGGSAD